MAIVSSSSRHIVAVPFPELDLMTAERTLPHALGEVSNVDQAGHKPLST